MPSIVDTLTQLGQDLRDAIASVRGVYTDVSAIKDSAVSQTTTIINNFTNRAPSASWYIDFNNGVDAAGYGQTDTKCCKTLDYALDNCDRSVKNDFWMFTDQQLTRWHVLLSTMSFIGVVKIPSGPYGFPYTFVLRKLRFAAEATNSPRTDLGRVPAFLDCQGGSLTFRYMDVIIPAQAQGVNYNCLISAFGLPFSFIGCTIEAESIATTNILFATPAGQVTASFQGTGIADSAKGKIFAGIAAGADPNSSFFYRSNITAA